MKKYNVEINIYGRILNEMDPEYFGSFGNAWFNHLEDAETFIFRRTSKLDEQIMAYKATIFEDKKEIAFWTNDIKNAK